MSDDLGMKALAGPLYERAAASLDAGCDVVLHCDGNMADMEAVAKGSTPLGPNGLSALKDAASIRLKPSTIFENVLAADFGVMDAFRRG